MGSSTRETSIAGVAGIAPAADSAVTHDKDYPDDQVPGVLVGRGALGKFHVE